MQFLFIPFAKLENNTNLIGMAANWQRAHALQDASFGQVENRVYTQGQRVLEDIARDDVVHILAHGQGTDYVVNDTVQHPMNFMGQQIMGNAVLDARTLAERVHGSGLPLRHRVIRLCICNTNGTMDRFARAFRDEMWQLNYTGALEVYYYAASVSIPRPVQGQPGQVAQHVLFTGAPGSFVATPSGIAPVGQLIPAAPFMYRV
ncbi:hypothetical protein A7982_12669 [Minicystis rosea]|nr:hypothetical protein A7982_12669 [Minicystis rosea]